MFGFLVGAVCLVGLVKVLRGRGGWGHHSHGYGAPAFAGCGGPGMHGRWGGRQGGPWEPWEPGFRGREGDRSGGAGRFGGWGSLGGFGGGFSVVSRIAAELRLTREQEDVLRGSLRQGKAAMKDARGALGQARKDLAEAIRQESFDEVLLAEAVSRMETATQGMQKAIIGAVGDVHKVLDGDQRKRLASILEHGPFG
jgi:uncharacterized membrane protein